MRSREDGTAVSALQPDSVGGSFPPTPPIPRGQSLSRLRKNLDRDIRVTSHYASQSGTAIAGNVGKSGFLGPAAMIRAACGNLFLTPFAENRHKVRITAMAIWSGRRDSNPRPRPWQGRALPLSYTRIL
jgi:hypothetical protein